MDTACSLTDRCYLHENPGFKKAVLLLSVQHAQHIMNQKTTDDNIRLKMKAVELLNQPETFQDRLSISVAALLPIESMPFIIEGVALEDERVELLQTTISDAFDAIAGQGI